MQINLFKDYTIYKNIFPVDENRRKIDIYKFENCFITGINLYYPNILIKTNNELILPTLERTMSLKSGTIYEKYNMTFNYTEKECKNICDSPVFFFIYNTDNYFHFLYDSLPYLISYLNIKNSIPKLKLLMQFPNEQKNTFYPFINEFLEILNINKEDIILVNENTLYSEVYVSTSYTHDINSNLPPRKEIYDFFQDIVISVKNKYNIITPQKIYVSRRTWLHNNFSNIGTNYTTRRKLINEDELVQKLEKEGFTEVFTENLTTIEKILYFANAKHVVGAIGGGISNVLFSPKATKLEAIVSPTFLDVNSRFKYSLNCVDVFYNTNTEHFEKTEFKTYMRVKKRDGTIVGEIEKIYDNKLLISYTNGSNTGWNAQNIYSQIDVDITDIEKLDNGLNSPWKIII
jgi:hypothetical protein